MIGVESAAAPAHIVQTLRQASLRTGADFDYLLNTAIRESGLKSQAKAKTSSAAGMFQFIEQTWLRLIKNYGADHGLGTEATQVQEGPGGKLQVASPEVRSAILALRHDTKTAALMAGAFARESADSVTRQLGRAPKSGELYIAHVMGATGATKLITAAENTPEIRASSLFPEAARANKSLFYAGSGRHRSVAELYDLLRKKGGAGEGGAQTVASGQHPSPPRTSHVPERAAEPHLSLRPGLVEFVEPPTRPTSSTAFLLSSSILEVMMTLNPVEPVVGRSGEETEPTNEATARRTSFRQA